MIVDHRTYTFKPGTVQTWVAKYVREGLPIQKRHLGKLIGLYTTEIGNLHQTVMLWAYESLSDREARRAQLSNDPDWKKYMDEIWAMEALQSQEIKILAVVDAGQSN